ncbi:MAG: flagellar M-ring protein FliF [Oleispira sp.]|nr:flagellar M-ring protein FliF [Oleispira sp.]
MANAVATPTPAQTETKAATNAPSELADDDSIDDLEQDIHPVVSGFNKLSIVRQGAILGGFALAIASTIAIFIWSKEPNFKPLINRLQDYNAQEIIEILQREGFEFEIDPSSQVLMIRADELHDARLKLAAASLIDDKTVGLELLDNESNLGTSHFIETARYRRGLEGELARTIASVQAIRNARVHLAIPKQSVFVRDHRKPRASVFLELYAGANLHKDQVEAIVNLVASSISEMDKDAVAVVDQKGNLLSKIESDSGELLATKQLQYTERLEESIRSRVNSILKPVLGIENYHAQVSADVDFTVVEQSEEIYNPDLIAIRSEQLINEQTVNSTEGGIPGALSNQPPGAAEAPEEIDPVTGQPIVPMDKRSETTRNYEVDRTISYKQQQVGKINRLTVAVVINDKESISAETGEMQFVPWAEADLDRLEILVKDAVGFNAARGDSVNVINSPFMGRNEVELGSPEFWTQPWFWEIMKQVLAGLFLLVLIFGVIRPTINSIANKGKTDDDMLGLDELADAEDEFDEDRVTLSGADDFLLPGASESFERQLDALKGLIAEDPARVAQVVIAWINSEEDQ